MLTHNSDELIPKFTINMFFRIYNVASPGSFKSVFLLNDFSIKRDFRMIFGGI